MPRGQQESAQTRAAVAVAARAPRRVWIRSRAVVWLTLAVVAAHLGALWWIAAQAAMATRPAAGSAAAHRWVVARALSSAGPAHDQVAPRLAPAEAPARPPERHVPPPSIPMQPAISVPDDAGDGVPTDAADTPSAAPTRYYGYDEVDAPAEPSGDWNIDVQAFDALALSRIVVTLYIDAAGGVVRCTVDEPARLTAAERQALADRLAQTPLQPARRRGVAVASKRRIELSSAEGG